MNLTRRDLMRAAAMSMAGYSASGWLPALADEAAKTGKQRHCVLLWMTGGPSQTDTFDMKPGHENGGEFKEIETNVPGVRFSEHLPGLAKWADQMAIIRSLSTKEGDHGRGTYLMRTGHRPMGPIRYPAIGSSLSKALGSDEAEMPNYISVAPYRVFNREAFGPGFLGPKYAPLTVAAADNFNQQQQAAGEYANLNVDDLYPPSTVNSEQTDGRLALWDTLQKNFVGAHRGGSAITHDTVYRRAVKMMRSEAAGAFDLEQEPEEIREAYGRGRFGQGCLLARRLIERGVPFVEVTLRGRAIGWDTHNDNFNRVKALSEELDAGWSMLMQQLKERDLLEQTTIVWLGEFGRTPKINRNGGRDHFPAAWSCVLAGGGIYGGQTYGRTSEDGTTVEEGKVDVGDVLATACRAVGIDPGTQNMSGIGRPIRVAEGKPIEEVLA